MSDTPKLPTREEQEREYQDKRVAFERKYAEWKRNPVGPPPPYPVPPHTPGWKLPESS